MACTETSTSQNQNEMPKIPFFFCPPPPVSLIYLPFFFIILFPISFSLFHLSKTRSFSRDSEHEMWARRMSTAASPWDTFVFMGMSIKIEFQDAYCVSPIAFHGEHQIITILHWADRLLCAMQQPTVCVQVVFHSSETVDVHLRNGCLCLSWQTLLVSVCPACLVSVLFNDAFNC